MADEVMVDVMIFGASGYTGKYVVRELMKFAHSSASGRPRRVGIAGRNKAKLSASLQWALEGKPEPAPVSIIEANVNDPSSIAAMCRKARLVVNCVGPYSKYGEPVVAACVDAGVDYLDITGEPEFIERIEHKYDEEARKKCSLVVNACGYDSIPAEFGAIFTARQFQPPALPQTCDSYLVVSSMHLNVGTWESLVLIIAQEKELQALRKSRPRRPRPEIPGAVDKKSLVHYEENSGIWAVRLASADEMMVRKTYATKIQNPEGLPTSEEENPEFLSTKREKWDQIKPVQFGVYFGTKYFVGLITYFLFGIILSILAPFKLGRALLFKYPEIFSFGLFKKQGPSEEQVRNAYFQQWFVCKGFSDASKPISKTTKPDMKIVTRISGPEVGYLTTPICLIQCALMVLDERSKLPKGGVLTPGAAFATTDLIERLSQNGLKFDVISTTRIQMFLLLPNQGQGYETIRAVPRTRLFLIRLDGSPQI
ncbi:hypothetical protein R1sor_017107 [Riccia sorocarpa]|uniref:Saccharopine dehydrogenase NADP binding domain-containing protein n=1 Tax=Riccia sorocarpa TaxID=122646 RepID=A0ABD3I9G5_9MARC